MSESSPDGRPALDVLAPVVRSYAWGSRTAIPRMCGRQEPSAHPIAEYWFGAHDSGPSALSDGRGLDDLLAQDPQGQLGIPLVHAGFTSLPYLVKLLSAEQALSLQAHPSREQAVAGFAAENALGIPVDAPNRNYRDDNHKPEILVALTPFAVLAGFRSPERTVELLDTLGVESLRPYRDILAAQPDASGLRAVFTTFVTLPGEVLTSMVDEVVRGAVQLLAEHGADHAWAPVAATLVDLGERYPGDSGVLGALLLNRFELAPGEAVYLGAGNLHAYLDGTGVEVMANSDNVLRGGLTPKHVDVPELLRVLDFEPLAHPVVRCADDPSAPGWSRYPSEAEEFEVFRRELAPGESARWTVDVPEIVLVTRGQIVARPGGVDGGGDDAGDDAGSDCVVAVGSALWIPAGAGPVEVRAVAGSGTDDAAGDGAQLFRSRVQRVPERPAGAPGR